MKATVTETPSTDDAAKTEAASEQTTTLETPTLEEVPARIVEEDEAVTELRADIQALKACHAQTVSILKFLCGRLGLDPQKVLDQVQVKQD